MNCPICKRVCDEYKRPFAKNNLRVLRKFYQAWNGHPIRLSDAVQDNSEFIALRNCRPFGLIQKSSTRGLWYLTALGLEFLSGRNIIPKWVVQYNGETIEKSESYIRVDSELPDKDNPESKKWRGLPPEVDNV